MMVKNGRFIYFYVVPITKEGSHIFLWGYCNLSILIRYLKKDIFFVKIRTTSPQMINDRPLAE